MVEFPGHYDHFHISNQLTFFVDPPTSEGGFHNPSLDLTSLTFYQPMVQFSCYPNYLLWTSSHEHHVCSYPLLLLSNAFFGTTSELFDAPFQ